MATTILHVDSSPLGEASASRRLTADIVAALRSAAPGARVLRRDLVAAPLGHLSGTTLQGWGAADLAALAPEARAEAELSEAVLAEFLAADILVVWATIIWMVIAIWPSHRWVALAQGPYLAWVSIATVLQLSITWMNRGR